MNHISPHSFDQNIAREGTQSLKYDGRLATFGISDVMPMWVADMDFSVPEAITKALQARANHPVFGYSIAPESLYEALIDWLLAKHDWQVKREWIVLTPGVVTSLNIVVAALTAENAGVIVQPPVYFPFFSAVTNSILAAISRTSGLVNSPIGNNDLANCSCDN